MVLPAVMLVVLNAPPARAADDWAAQMMKHSKKGSVEMGNALRASFQGRAPSKTTTTLPAAKGAPQNVFEINSMQDVIQECPQQFARYRDTVMVSFRHCTIQSVYQCKTKEKRDVAICNQAALDACRSSVDNFLSTVCSGKAAAATSSEKLAACNESEHLERSANGKSCQCGQLYTMNTKLKSCVFSGSRGLSLSTDAADALETAVEKLGTDESGTVELKLRNGQTIMLGVIRLPNGKYVFTPDGEHYVERPQDALSPSFLKSFGASLGDLSKSFKGFFGIGTYTGKDTAGNSDSQENGQILTDAAAQALENLQGAADPAKKLESAKELLDQWVGRGKNILGEKWDSLLLDELKNATGISIPFLKKALTGESDLPADVLKKLYAFPAQSVIIMAKEIRGANFTNAARIYARERATGKTPAQIMELLQSGQLPDLDFVSSIQGVGQQFARGSLLLSYEETFQRYELAKKLKPLRK